jgi:hypothetical protein
MNAPYFAASCICGMVMSTGSFIACGDDHVLDAGALCLGK